MRHIGSHELVKLAGARLQHVDEPQAEQLWSKLSTIVERPGQPVALIPRKRGISCVRASVLPSLKNRDTFADTSRATLSCTGGQGVRRVNEQCGG